MKGPFRLMLYQAYQALEDMAGPMRALARFTGTGLRQPSPLALMLPQLAPALGLVSARTAAAATLFADTTLTHERPPYGIASVMVGNREVEVTEQPVVATAFGTLLHFKKDVVTAQPKVLVIAPLSGHFATLLRDTVRTLLADHDVFITDWHNAREAPLGDGRFGFDEYVQHIIDFVEAIGPGTHLVAVCQPCVQAIAAAAVMAESGSRATPRSMTLMAGPVDTRINPTEVNKLATSKPISWFENNLIARVPARYAGAGRRVYPGFLQVTAFMTMNLPRHIRAHLDLLDHMANGNDEMAARQREFYDEYFAVLDLDADFYLETVQWVFQDYRLARGTLTFKGAPVNPAAIRRTALLTVEGEKDDICAVGQTLAAHDLCAKLRPALKKHHLQPGVGHYGVFSGSRWRKQIYPLVKNVILSTD